MQLNIKWIGIREADVLQGILYFVADIHKGGGVKDFCIAYKVLEKWKVDETHLVSFEATHVCRINEVTHDVSPPAYAIGDTVKILTTFYGHKKGSVGNIVGKYNSGRTWCIRMEDDFVILVTEGDFCSTSRIPPSSDD